MFRLNGYCIYIYYIFNYYKTYPLPVGFSDHTAMNFQINFTAIKKPVQKSNIFRPITFLGKYIFYNYLENTDWSFLDNENTNTNLLFN